MRTRFVVIGLVVMGSALAGSAFARAKRVPKSSTACLGKCRKLYDKCIDRAGSDGGAARSCVRLADACEVQCDK